MVATVLLDVPPKMVSVSVLPSLSVPVIVKFTPLSSETEEIVTSRAEANPACVLPVLEKVPFMAMVVAAGRAEFDTASAS